MNNIISVIIPVYNVEPYIKQCIESVCGQKYKELQIILIDDGSTDKSGLICDEYATKDKRITVIHQKNGGAAKAKNTGLKLATGKYVTFLDADDYLEKDAYVFMRDQLEKYHADIVQCGFYEVFTNSRRIKVCFDKEEVFDNCSYLELFTKDWTCGLLWDKLYLREIFEDIYFEEGHKIDDEFFTYRGVIKAKKIVRVPYIVYNYRQRLSGVMLSETSQEQIIMDTLEYLSIRRKRVEKTYPQLKEVFDIHYLNMLLILSRKAFVSVNGLEKIKNLLYLYSREENKVKISFSLWRKLKKLQYSSIKKLLKQRENKVDNRDSQLYYQ